MAASTGSSFIYIYSIPLALGHLSSIYPWQWSIYSWIEGRSANELSMDSLDLGSIASDLAQFLNELHRIDTAEAPLPGPHNFYRGAPPSVYDTETRSAIKELEGSIDTQGATSVWEKALASKWDQDPVWIHGDLSSGNIIIKEGKLNGVIDFGGMAIGDPACDLVITWTFLQAESSAFRANEMSPEELNLEGSKLNLDPNTWARARGWALWKALITLAQLKNKGGPEAIQQQNIIKAVIDEHNRLQDIG